MKSVLPTRDRGPFPPIGSTRLLQWGALILAIALPASYVLFYLLPQSGELPERDYWWVLANIYSLEGLSPHWDDWLTRNNEHLLFIPSVIYALNLFLTRGSNLGLCLATVGAALIQCLLLIRLLPSTGQRDTSRGRQSDSPGSRSASGVTRLLILGVAIFCFTPVAAHNWMRGFSGAIWMTTNLFVVAAIFCFQPVLQQQISPDARFEPATPPVKGDDHAAGVGGRPVGSGRQDAYPTVNSQRLEVQALRSWPWVVLSLLWGGLAALSYSSSLALWPVLAVAVVMLRFRWPLRLTYLGAAIVVWGLYFLTYQKPAHHPDLASPSSLQTLVYIPRYLGWIFSDRPGTAIFLGTIGIGLCLGFAGYWLFTQGQRQRPEWFPWLAIQGYILGTAAMAAVSRSGFGLAQAQTSRYGSLPALFWLATIVLIVTAMQTWGANTRWRSRCLLALLALLLILIGNMYRIGVGIAQTIALQAAHQPLVALSLQLGVQDPAIVRAIVGNRPAAFFHLIPVLTARQLVPFSKDIRQHNDCVVIGHPLAPLAPDAPPVIGAVTTEQWLADDVVTLEGWINAPRNSVRCLALVDQHSVTQGFALPGLQRAENVIQVQGSTATVLGWKGYAQAPENTAKSSDFGVYVAFNDRSGWVALRNHPD
ncbi:hypothetical protein [Trichothermofontia sp.]